jgi:MFS family permease
MPLLNTIVSHRTPLEYRGRLLGTTSAASSWGRVAGPMIAGVNLGIFGYSGGYLGSAAFVLFYLAWALREYRRQGSQPPGDVQGSA